MATGIFQKLRLFEASVKHSRTGAVQERPYRAARRIERTDGWLHQRQRTTIRHADCSMPGPRCRACYDVSVTEIPSCVVGGQTLPRAPNVSSTGCLATGPPRMRANSSMRCNERSRPPRYSACASWRHRPLGSGTSSSRPTRARRIRPIWICRRPRAPGCRRLSSPCLNLVASTSRMGWSFLAVVGVEERRGPCVGVEPSTRLVGVPQGVGLSVRT